MLANLLDDPESAFETRAPRRVVSLVPSMTASMYDLGLGDVLVGVSDYCPFIEGGPNPARVGGPKTPDLAAVAALKPDLVLVNKEENSRLSVEELAAMGLKVWMTFPTGVEEAVQDLWTLSRLFRSDDAMQAVAVLEKSIEWARLSMVEATPVRCFCSIWEDRLPSGERWWMTFNSETYPGDVMALVGMENVFSARSRRYPLEADLGIVPETETEDLRDRRYPRVPLGEIIAAQPEIILLPDEPYPYSAEHTAEAMKIFAGTPAAESGRIYCLDGSLLFWHGTRLGRALEELPHFLTI